MPPPGPGVRVVSWGISQAEAGRLGLWIGLSLVAFGGYLVLASFLPGVAALGSVALAIIGCALVGWHLAGRAGAWAVHAGVVLGGFGIARVVAEIAGLPSAGWGSLGAGLGLLLIAAARLTRGEGVRWQAWVGGALAVFGGWGVLGATIPGFPTFGDMIVPARPRPDRRRGPPARLSAERRPAARQGPAAAAPGACRLAPPPYRAVATSIAPATPSAIVTSSSSVVTKGGPRRTVSPSTPFAAPVPE